MRHLIAITGMLTLMSGIAHATQIKYEYVGAQISFDPSYSNAVDMPDGVTRLSGYFILNDLLLPNTVNAVTPISYLFSDGLVTAGSDTPGYFAPGGREAIFSITTDANGDFDKWFIFVGRNFEDVAATGLPADRHYFFQSVKYYDGSGNERFDDETVYRRVPGVAYGVHGVADTSGRGVWSVSVVPAPAAVWLFGSALGLMGWLRRRASP